MIPATFDYEVAGSVEEAIELLGSREDAKLLAGGHSLLPLMKLRLARPALLVDIGRLDELSYVRDAGERLAIGALTRHHDLAHDPLLAGALRDRLARRGADRRPAGAPPRHDRRLGRPRRSRLGPADRAARARRRARRRAGRAASGRAGGGVLPRLFETALGPQDVLTEIRVPKLGRRRAGRT